MLNAHKTLTDLFDNSNLGFDPQAGNWADNFAALAPWAPPFGGWLIPGEAGKPVQPTGTSSSGTTDQSVLISPYDSKPAHGKTSSGSSSGAGGTTLSGSTSGTAATSLVINISWDTSVQSAPSAFTTAVMSAVQYLESQISDPVTINIAVGYGEENGNMLGSGALGQSQAYVSSVSYAQLVSALSADATSATDASVVASLPASSPVNGGFWTTNAQTKALGLAPASGTSLDGYVGFSNTANFTYNDSTGVAAGSYDFNAVVLHEITEVMGRQLFTGMTLGSGPAYTAYDLLHYSAPGVPDFSASTPGYFSTDGGTTALAAFNTASGGDPGDWASSVTNDSADAFSSAGTVNAFSTVDLTAMDAIGWNLTSTTITAPPAAAPAPTGVSVSPVTATLAGAQGGTGLVPNQALASIAQVGGTSGDQFTYTLAGSGASAFALTTGNNVASLFVSSAGAPGAANGELYALALTATDTTTGTSSPATGLNVVVAGSGNDTVPLSVLVGPSGTATPTLVYGLAGADTINATGMTGSVWLVGGVGADILTGGSGANDYLYAAISDSAPSAMDVITNFNVGMDRIDLSGIGTALSYVGAIKTHGKGANTLAPGSIGYMQSAGNTYVFVNSSSGTQSVGATSMEIDLRGSLSLSAGNFIHH